MKALIVDDSKPIRSIITRVLTGLKFECFEATNGDEALEVLGRISKPNLVTINWHMPQMDGIELIRRLRSSPLHRNLTLLMISSEQDRSKVETAIKIGANDYLSKPFTAAALIRKLVDLGVCTTQDVASSGAFPRGQIKVMLIDDSAAIRSVLSSVLSLDLELRVVGMAVDGQKGLDMVRQNPPDVVLLDVEMPVMDGLTTLRLLRKSHPKLPVIMFSSLTERGAKATLDALVAGANDYVAKPKGNSSTEVADKIRSELIPKIKALAPRTVAESLAAIAVAPRQATRTAHKEAIASVVVGVSTGGPSALADLLPAFVFSSGVPVLIVQHMPPLFTAHLAERLSKICGMPVREAQHGQLLTSGDVLLAPGGVHMEVIRDLSGFRIALTHGPLENSCKPSVDVLFRSAAVAWGPKVLGVILTGMGKDGLVGCESISKAGGEILAQDEISSVVWGMPGHVARAGLADAVLPLSQMGMEISLRLKRRGL